jgi:heat shock protein HslJ
MMVGGSEMQQGVLPERTVGRWAGTIARDEASSADGMVSKTGALWSASERSTMIRVLGNAIVGMFMALPASGIAQPPSPLGGSEWRPIVIAETEVPADSDLFVRFGGKGRVEGYGGCNRFFATFEIAADSIAIGRIGATRRACPGPVMELKSRFLRQLEASQRYRRERVDLTLGDAEGNTLMQLIQTDAD